MEKISPFELARTACLHPRVRVQRSWLGVDDGELIMREACRRCLPSEAQ